MATSRKSTPVREWPPLDREAWNDALTVVSLMEPDGLAAAWRPATRRFVEEGYGYWLAWLERRGLSGSNLAARRSYYAFPSRILSQLPPFQSRYRHSGESPRFSGSRHLCDVTGSRSNASPPTHSSCARPERRSRPEAAPRGRQLRLVRAWHPNDGRGRGSRA